MLAPVPLAEGDGEGHADVDLTSTIPGGRLGAAGVATVVAQQTAAQLLNASAWLGYRYVHVRFNVNAH